MRSKIYWESPSWRDEAGMESHPVYKKKWAIKPIVCSDGTKVWFKTYYIYYRVWGSKHHDNTGIYRHRDFVENITEAEYLVRKLADNL
jgi:hypothetical protein